VLGDLGVRLDGMGRRIEAIELLSAGGRPVMEVDAERLEARFGAPMVVTLRRSLLHRHGTSLRWWRGRCVLSGDAVHTMPPILALGANQGLEDVSALLRVLGDADASGASVPDVRDLPRALDVYERSRRPQAATAAALATRAVATSGPRTLLQSEFVLRAAVMPGRLPNRMIEALLRGISGRLRTARPR
jgi:2-polyprenyl-6-methoxyphenol hydroxylase-like FAD-dependent oxidoreductase